MRGCYLPIERDTKYLIEQIRIIAWGRRKAPHRDEIYRSRTLLITPSMAGCCSHRFFLVFEIKKGKVM
jgi:hypothetical protein